ncbi:hypothetical protein PR202_ga12288 [Eleusine coracana subsp. coracana]|uniref:AT3G52170-like helix-turn-helix domain-containing protein n=1 Tax=Eleusine coracana subsp. coracana TaxID=191504 RepID=A0AAV5CBT6_ELECO|nr:hypothetical protein PR202_ga12288 [Eleusine coracana subsp. coracana]
MQAAAGSVSWVAAQPSVLGRCGGGGAPCAAARGTARGGGGGRAVGVPRCCVRAQEKRPPRVRKTKEERRELVESFINNYRVSNDGKFPSVNLTHKEVGGSYYIVREIVRDIIQENKVLGPGGLNATALSFEDCPDSSELSMNHEFGQDTIEALQTPDDSQVLHDSVSEISNREEYSLQNNVIITQTLLGSSNLLEAGVLNHEVQNGNAAGTTCLETSLEKQDSDQSGGSVEVDLNISGEQGSPSAYVFVSEKETELDSLEDSEEGVVSGVTNGAILSPESNASDETNVAVLREHETLPNNCHDGTIDGVVNEINLPENTNGVLHTKQTTLQDHEALSGSVSSDVAQIMDDQSRSKMDGFTSITDSSETEVRTKTVELSNEHNLQDEFEPLLVDSNHDEQENSENLVSQPTSDAKVSHFMCGLCNM